MINYNYKKWGGDKVSILTLEEKEWIRENAKDYTVKELSKRFFVSEPIIRYFCKKNNVQFKYKKPQKARAKNKKPKVVKMKHQGEWVKFLQCL